MKEITIKDLLPKGLKACVFTSTTCCHFSDGLCVNGKCGRRNKGRQKLFDRITRLTVLFTVREL